MSQTKAHPGHIGTEDKKAVEEFDQHAQAGGSGDPVPAPEDGGHARSHAAHLEVPKDVHTTPAGNLRQGASPSERREPPQEVSRVGKGHRRE